MAAEAKHREAIVAAAVRLFRQRGYSGTGINDIVAESGAPKGSIYHYFPEGKAQIGAAAVALAGRFFESRIEVLAAEEGGGTGLLRRLFGNAAQALEESGFRNGCPVAAVVVDTPPDVTGAMAAADGAFGVWRCGIAAAFVRAGLPEARAAFLASVAVSVFEGGLIQARAARNVAPLIEAGEALAMIAEAELAKAR